MLTIKVGAHELLEYIRLGLNLFPQRHLITNKTMVYLVLTWEQGRALIISRI